MTPGAYLVNQPKDKPPAEGDCQLELRWRFILKLDRPEMLHDIPRRPRPRRSEGFVAGRPSFAVIQACTSGHDRPKEQAAYIVHHRDITIDARLANGTSEVMMIEVGRLSICIKLNLFQMALFEAFSVDKSSE